MNPEMEQRLKDLIKEAEYKLQQSSGFLALTDKPKQNLPPQKLEIAPVLKSAVQLVPVEKVDLTKQTKKLMDEYFTLKPTQITPEVEKELHIIRNRHVLDPKRFYKKQKLDLKLFQMGEIIGGDDDFKRDQMTRKQKQLSIVDELLNDQKSREYMKRKVGEVQERGRNKTRNGYFGKKKRPNKK
jgi:Fcf2 pre-rRNA processing